MSDRPGRFQGLGTILLQPYDEDLNRDFEFEIASAAEANDGAIPFGQTLAGTPNGSYCEIRKHPEHTNYTTEILGVVANTNTVVSIPISYPYVTKLDGGEPLGETSILVLSTSGMTVGDRVGIMQDSKIIHWSVISSVATDGVTFVIAVGLVSVAATTNKVFVPRIVRGKYHLTIVCYFSGGGDKEFNFNRIEVRDI